MSLGVADGTITLTTGSAGTTFDVTGLAFQPQAIFFFWSGRATAGQGEADAKFGAGFATGTSARRAYTSQSDHGNASSQADAMWRNDCCVATLSTAGAIVGRADLNAINSDGFQLIIDAAFAAGLVVGWIAYGGSDITNVTIVDITEPTATGNQDYATGFALNTGLDDKAVIFLGGIPAAVDTSSPHSTFMMGMAAGNTIVQGVLAGTSMDAQGDSFTRGYCRASQCLAALYPDDIINRASLSAWLSDGFRLNWTEYDSAAQSANDFRYSALVIKGGRWRCGDSLTRTDTTQQDEVVGIVPKSLLLGSGGKAASTDDVASAINELIIGCATSAASRRAAGMCEKHFVTTMDIGIAYAEDAMYVNQDTATTVAVEGKMDLVDFVVSGDGFTYVMTDADPVASFFFYLAGGDAPGGGLGPRAQAHYARRRRS